MEYLALFMWATDGKPPIMRKGSKIALIITVITLGILVLTLSSEASGDDWTIMVYLDGDNDLKAYAADDFEEMGNTNADLDLVVLYDKNTTGQDDTKLYHYINGRRSEQNPNWLDDEMNLGAQETLEEFVSWSMAEYYSDHIMLVFWDHGGAWKGCCWDEHDGDDNLRLPEIREALNNSLGGEKLDLLYFGACSMSTMEVCYELQDQTDYIIGSEKTGWVYWDIGFNLNFRELFEYMEGNYDMPDICDYIVDESMDIQVIMEGQSHTWSAMKMNDIPDLSTALDVFAEELIEHFPDHYMKIIQAREDTEEYKSGKRVDIYHFAENILTSPSLPQSLKNASMDVMDAVNNTVIANGKYTGTQAPSRGTRSMKTEVEGIIYDSGDKEKEESRADFAHGIQIYFPINRSVKYSDYLSETLGPFFFTERTIWDYWIWYYLDYIFVDDDATGTEDGSLENPFSTIQEAIDEAGSRDIIRVFAGTYYEGIEVNERLTLIGNGTNTVIDCPEGNAVNITHERVTLSKLFIYTPLGQDDIEIQANLVNINNCTLSNAGENVVHIMHADTVTLDNCSIRMATGSGVMIADSDDVTMINCEIYDNIEHGVALFGSTDTTFSLCRIHDNGDDGIYVSGTSNTLIWDNDIYDNVDHGVYVGGSSSDTDARYCFWGDWSGPGGDGPGSGNGITRDVLYSPWVELSAGTQPNQIYHVDTTGVIQDAVDHAEAWDLVLIHKGTYTENVEVYKTLIIQGFVELPPYPTISGENGKDAMFITADWVTITKLNFTTILGGDNCIQIGDNVNMVSNVIVYECNFIGSPTDLIEFAASADGNKIHHCTISSASKNGIIFKKSNDLAASNNLVEYCEILNSGENGAEVEEGCLLNTITNCDIHDNSRAGVTDDGTNTHISFCELHSNGYYGVEFWHAEYSWVHDSDIYGNSFNGVYEFNPAIGCDAMFNFWGNESGPGGAGPGHGNGINANVDYSPWAKYPFASSPQTFIVDETGKIQDALDHAEMSDTVRVWAGEYYEHLEIEKSLNLIGNGSASDPANNTIINTSNSSVALQITGRYTEVSDVYFTAGSGLNNPVVTINVRDVTIDNCSVVGGGTTGVYIDASAIYCNLQHCSISNAVGYGLEARGTQLTLNGSNIFRNGNIGVYLNYSGYNYVDSRILMSNISDNSDTGIYVNGGSGVYIEGCTINGNAEGGVVMMNVGLGWVISCDISDNQENGLYFASSDNLMVEYCDITGNEENGIRISSSDHCRISWSQVITNGEHGVYASGSDSVRIRYSNINKNVDKGVNNPTIALPVDARYNYWGHLSGPGGEGPGIGDEISENVIYSPWYGYKVGSFPQTICTDGSETGIGGGKLQNAIDLAQKGDTVKVFAGTYLEHIVIDKQIILQGNGSKDTIIDGRGLTNVIQVTKGADGTIIKGFRVVGSGENENNAGISILASGCRILGVECYGNLNGIRLAGGRDNIVVNSHIHGNKFGLVFEEVSSSSVTNCTIANNEMDGIAIRNSDGVAVNGNVIKANGLGLLVWDGSKNVMVNHNSIFENKDFAIRMINADGPINATRNFWGKEGGPYHVTKNPGSRDFRGGTITDDVDFSPWLDAKGNLVYSLNDVEGNPDEEGNDGEFIPGFTLLPALYAIFALVILVKIGRRKKKNSPHTAE